MSLEPTFEEQELFADTFLRDGSKMDDRERFVELLVSAAFVVAVAAIWVLEPPGQIAVLPSALCLIVLAVAAMVRIDTPFGFTVPIQLGFVPLLFAMPLALVPVAVVVVLAAVRLPAVLRGEMRASRLLQTPGNAWFSIGPVAVFALAGVSPEQAGPLLLVSALAAQVVVDFVISSTQFFVLPGASLSSQLSESWWVYAIDAALSGIALVVAENVKSAPAAALALLPLLGLLAIFARERHHRLTSLIELGNAYRGTALVLKDVIDADDGYTGEHSQSVVTLTLNVAEAVGLSAERRRNLEFAALLHDVGKIAIPKEILNKPGKLDPEEWEIIKTHVVEGEKMLDQVGGFMCEVAQIVRSHHERWDGRGYPDGLEGEAIPLESRIIACCDAWNAMRTNRVYRSALPFEVAREELTLNAGRQFDPQVVEVLLEVIEQEAAAEAAAAEADPVVVAEPVAMTDPDAIAEIEVVVPSEPPLTAAPAAG